MNVKVALNEDLSIRTSLATQIILNSKMMDSKNRATTNYGDWASRSGDSSDPDPEYTMHSVLRQTQ